MDARIGFEVAWFTLDRDAISIDGTTAAVQDGAPWVVSYTMRLDHTWTTQWARVRTRTTAGEETVELTAVEPGRWSVNGRPAPHLAGCVDVDLEASALTNAFPVHRLGAEVDEAFPAPAAYVRVTSPAVERLEQRYVRLPDRDGRHRYDYEAPAFGFTCQIDYDEHGLVVDYPGIARRAPHTQSGERSGR